MLVVTVCVSWQCVCVVAVCVSWQFVCVSWQCMCSYVESVSCDIHRYNIIDVQSAVLEDINESGMRISSRPYPDKLYDQTTIS